MAERIVPMPISEREDNLLCWRELVRLAREYQSWGIAAPKFILFMLDQGTLEDHIEVSGPCSVHGLDVDEDHVIIEGTYCPKVWIYGFCFQPQDWSRLIKVQSLVNSENEWLDEDEGDEGQGRIGG